MRASSVRSARTCCTTRQPDLAANKLVGRDNVIITPHSAFYSTTAIEDLERLSCENIVHFLKGEKEKVFKLVNEVRAKRREGRRKYGPPSLRAFWAQTAPVTKFAMANRRFSEAENRHQALCRTSSGSVGASGPKHLGIVMGALSRPFSRESGWMLRAERQDAPSGAGRRLVVSCP